MGKMILDDLRKRLERLDEDADLMIDNDDRYQMVIVGGSAFILLGKLTRATHDIDALIVPKELYSLLGKYDINTDVEAYIDNFPYNFQDRLQPLPFGGTKVQFYTPSLEDLVIAKLCSFRDTDKADVESEAVWNSLDWDLLEHLATDEDELRASILNDWRYRDFYIRYQEYYVYANFGLTCVDDTHIYIGEHTMIGPNCVLATANHPILPELREKAYQYNLPIRIGRNCWLGAGVIVVPGVTIGDNTVIGAGSVVTKDIPANVVAVGNPCHVLSPISEHDKECF